MRIILDAHQTDDTLDHILDLITTVRTDHAELRSRFLTDRDGYPTQSLGGGGGATNEVDDDGTPIPQHSDPVGRLVIARIDATDTTGAALASCVNHIRNAMRELEAAISDAARVRPPAQLDANINDQVWCVSCLRIKHCSPIYEKSRARQLCRWCLEFEQAFGVRPPEELVDRHARGARITNRDVHNALRKPRNRGKRKTA